MATVVSTSETKYREMLAGEFLRRQRRNSGYSLRAFAKQMGVSPATLSQVLNGKRSLSRTSTMRIADRLFSNLSDRRKFLMSALGISHHEENAERVKVTYSELDADQFKLIAEWYHFAILSLAKIKPNRSEPEWVANRLAIQKRQAGAALERLLRLGLIVLDGEGFSLGTEPLFVNPMMSSAAVRSYHSENLQKAQTALDQTPRELRDITSITVATSPEKVDAAREMIRKFREELCSFLEEGHMSEVYTVAVQLFPVTVIEEGK